MVCIAFLEVESETFVLTIRKLCLVLLLHLVYLKAVGNSVKEVTGFVLPKLDHKNGVIAVTVFFHPITFKFTASVKQICKQELKQHVNTVVNQQINFVDKPPTAAGQYTLSNFISPDDVKVHLQVENLGNIRFFKNTKHSLTFVSENQQKVYKCSLIDNDLAMICLFGQKLKEVSNCVLFPEEPIPCTRFFTFPYLHEPLDIASIRNCFKWFANSVLLALEEFHEFGYAHLDVRPPNICFRHGTGGWQAVLIDLDRAVPTHTCSRLYNNGSFMYNEAFASADKYDWRQYALMLARVIEGNYDEYHTRPPKFMHTAEGKALQQCFESGVKPHLWVIDITLTSPKSLDNIFNNRISAI